MAVIYIFTNILNGKQYIGKTEVGFDKRLSEHLYESKKKRYNSVFYKAIRKYGIENFYIECFKVSNKFVNLWEKHLIKRWGSKVPNGYNLTNGGTGGFTGTNVGQFCKGQTPWNKGKKGIMPIPWDKGKKRSDMVGIKNPNAKSIILITPDNNEERFYCIRDACRKYKLQPQNVNGVLKGIRKHTMGFKARYING